MSKVKWKPEVGKFAMAGPRPVKILCVGNEFTFYRELDGIETVMVTHRIKQIKIKE